MTELAIADFELFKGRVAGARREVELVIERTARSPIIREKKDYFVAFFTAAGELITGTNMPLGATAVNVILEQFPLSDMRDGDVFAYNDPYSSHGGISHSPDFVMIAPVLIDEEVVAFSQVFGHLWDIGGGFVGSSSPAARDVYQEGTRIPPLKLARAGVAQEDILRIMATNSRFPDYLRGDLQALLSGCQLGARRVRELFEAFGVARSRSAIDRSFAQGEELMRQAVGGIPEGEYEFVQWIDAPADDMDPVHVTLSLRRSGDSLVLDATKTDDQSIYPINFIATPTVFAMNLAMFYSRLDGSVGINGGTMRAFSDVMLREGSLLAPRSPAPLGQRGILTIGATNALLGALAQATNQSSPAATPPYVVYDISGVDAKSGSTVRFVDGLGTGWGARSDADGYDCIYYVSQKNIPVEFIEKTAPIEVLQYRLRIDSGGAGRHRGGLGVTRTVRVLADGLQLTSRVGGVQHPAWGVDGGRSGEGGSVVVNAGTPEEVRLHPLCQGYQLRKGDIVSVSTSGGGGHGDPLDRPIERVVDDVLDGFVSVEVATSVYGVDVDVVNQRGAATAARRLGGRSGLVTTQGGV
ncbi:hydantoinase B/oxoprolinase family protein [Amycolatopsis sp. GM8]|uniref:hydantoinase B/oxoprolinase family protein n=1 Tax=Amycolatopsis sp. GM8 TaxID=2896530 RepID=UPI001F39D00F|nr:hydantoinase B/oxoprolinase family protein [Amycolatopsis sp. GM8]